MRWLSDELNAAVMPLGWNWVNRAVHWPIQTDDAVLQQSYDESSAISEVRAGSLSLLWKAIF